MGDAMTDDGTKLRQACIPCGVRLWADAEWNRIAAAARSLFGPAAEERAVISAAELVLDATAPGEIIDCAKTLTIVGPLREAVKALRASRKPKPRWARVPGTTGFIERSDGDMVIRIGPKYGTCKQSEIDAETLRVERILNEAEAKS